MIDRGFLRIAIGLALLVAVSAAAVGIYLYYNFNAQSRLPLIVPESSHWFVQIQTKKIKEEYKGNKPPYYDSFYQLIANAPVFKGCEDAGTPGVGLFSDVVLFETPNAKFMGLSVASENKLSAFLDILKSKNIVHGKIQKDQYSYVKIVNKNLYIAFKYKAMVFMEPFDSTENISFNEKALSEVFSGKESKFIHAAPIQKMYDQNAHVIWYHKHKNSKNETNYEIANGFKLDKNNLQIFTSVNGNPGENAPNMDDNCMNYIGNKLFEAHNLKLGTNSSLSKITRDGTTNAVDSLSNIPQNNNAQNIPTSEYFLNSIFKTAYQYILQLK